MPELCTYSGDIPSILQLQQNALAQESTSLAYFFSTDEYVEDLCYSPPPSPQILFSYNSPQISSFI